jgi:acetoacetyl-CoA synthetase
MSLKPHRNPGGVRFGSAELYDVIEHCFSFKGGHDATRTQQQADSDPHAIVVDCLAVGQSIAGGTDERVILFLQLAEGTALTPELEARIKTEIRGRRSARHVPARVRYFSSFFVR